MSALEDVVQRILLEGDSEVLTALNQIGDVGEEAFTRISHAAAQGASPVDLLGEGFIAMGTAIAIAGAAIITFVETADQSIIRLRDMAGALGTSVEELSAIQSYFAGAGVSATAFGRAVQRTAMDIGNSWSQIQRQVRESSIQQEAAQERIKDAMLGVRQAQDALSSFGSETAAKIEADNLHITESYVKLKFAAQEATSTMKHDFENVAGAALSVEAAQQRLDTLMGFPPTAAMKAQLQVDEAALALTKARTAQTDALRKQQEDMANAASKKAELELAHENALRKLQNDQQEATVKSIELVNRLATAKNTLAQADAHAHDADLRDLKKIGEAIESAAASGGHLAGSLNVTEVATHDLINALFLLASKIGEAPAGIDAWQKVGKTFSDVGEDVISHAQRIAIVTRLMGSNMRSAGMSAETMLKALTAMGSAFDPEKMKAQNKLYVLSPDDIKNVEAATAAFGSLTGTLSMVKDKLAALSSPELTKFFESVQSSLTESTGLLHLFVNGLIAVGSVLGTIWPLLVGIGIAAALAFGPVTFWIVVLTLVVTAIGAVYEKWDMVSGIIKQTWDNIKGFGDYMVNDFGNDVLNVVSRLLDKLGAVGQVIKAMLGLGGGAAPAEGGGAAPTGQARGGPISGPGGPTSDTAGIFALSDGEFVVRAAAVKAYGVDLFHALNNMALGGFAMGGLVPAPIRMASGGAITASPSILNLTIDGNHFNGLRAPADVADRLTSYAIGRQMSSTGKKPSWVK